MLWDVTKITDKIISEKADYIIAVKENQKTLYQEIKDEFRFSENLQSSTSQNLDHGRIETRTCTVIHSFSHLKNPEKWSSLKSIVRIQSIREFKNSNKPTEKATRYYISSLKHEAQPFNKAIREH